VNVRVNVIFQINEVQLSTEEHVHEMAEKNGVSDVDHKHNAAEKNSVSDVDHNHSAANGQTAKADTTERKYFHRLN